MTLPLLLPWKIGLELELLAPVGRSRECLANEIARSCDGRVKRIFYPQSEFTSRADATVFENLTLGFAVENAQGDLIAKCVDDLTLVDDLDAAKEPLEGWYRILSDDLRFLSLVEIHCDATADHRSVLEPLAHMYGVELETVNDEPLFRVSDRRSASIAMAAKLPGERHRPCELITAPIIENREEIIRQYLRLASDLSFSVPAEAAIHIHFDGEALKSARIITNVIRVFGHYRSDLNLLIGTNPNCRRLGDWPKTIYRLVSDDAFSTLGWNEVVERLRHADPVKFCDFNIVNLLVDGTDKNTFEVRIMPGSMDADFILKSVRFFEALLVTCVRQQFVVGQRLPELMDFIADIGLSPEDLAFWSSQWQANNKQSQFGLIKALKNLKNKT